MHKETYIRHICKKCEPDLQLKFKIKKISKKNSVQYHIEYKLF